MKITFVYPWFESTSSYYPEGYHHFFNITNISISTLVTLTPEKYEVEIVNEFYEDLNIENLNPFSDIVCISFFTPQATRAYRLANDLRKKGITVLGGGIHPSVMAQEAYLHFDSIVVGEAEEIWEKVLDDVVMKTNRKVYMGKCLSDMSKSVIADRDIFADKYQVKAIQPVYTTRGCHYKTCDTCVIPGIYGEQLRIKPLELVKRELHTIKDKIIYFVDDYFLLGNIEYSKALMEECKKLNKYFMVGGTPYSLSKNPDLLKFAYNCGCRAAYVSLGFDPQTKKGIFKHYDKLVEEVNIIKEAGIIPILSILFGLDDDDYSVFEKAVSFYQDVDAVCYDPGIIAPFPGTPFFEKLKKEHRLLHANWGKYNYRHAVFKPAKMTAKELEEGYAWHLQKYSEVRKTSQKWEDKAEELGKYITPVIAREGFLI